MKKKFNLVIGFTVVLSLLLLNTSGSVFAKKDPVVIQPGLAEGSWSAGTEVEINLDAEKYPGLQLLTNGVKISEPTKLCHEFRGGDYGWVGEIRLLKNGVWVKQPTTTGWVPDTEGAYMACTEASAAGTYALFGWYDAKSPKVRDTNYPPCDSKLLEDAAFVSLFNEHDGFSYDTSFSFLIPSMKSTPMKLWVIHGWNEENEIVGWDSLYFTSTGKTSEEGGLSLGVIMSDIQPDYIHMILYTPSCYFDLDPLERSY